MFDLKDQDPPKEASVLEHFRERKYQSTYAFPYGIQLKHPKMPVANVGNDARPVWVPPELCIVVPGQIPWGTVWRPETKFAAVRPVANAQDNYGFGLVTCGYKLDSTYIPPFVGLMADLVSGCLRSCLCARVDHYSWANALAHLS